MMNIRTATRSGLLLTLLAASAFSASTAMAESTVMTAKLFGAGEVPPVTGKAMGTADVTLDKKTNILTWRFTYSGLTGPATAGHFHGPAFEGKNAGVALPLTGDLASPISGTATLTADQAADVLAGKWYLNLHTAANPNGEIRGQVMMQRGTM